MQRAGWYADPTGRHEFRYWRPGWSEIAADGPDEVIDLLRPRWRTLLGLFLIAQLALVPVVGFFFISHSNQPDSRAGVVLAAKRRPPVPQVVYAPCPGEKIERVVLSHAGSKGTSEVVLWAGRGDIPPDTPIIVGIPIKGMHMTQRLQQHVGVAADLVLIVATNQLKNPQRLSFNMADVPSSGVMSYGGTYPDTATFRAAALADSPCGVENDGTKALLGRALIAQGLLALVGVGLLMLPYYWAPKTARV